MNARPANSEEMVHPSPSLSLCKKNGLHRSQSMLEMNEIAVIHQLSADFNSTILVDGDGLALVDVDRHDHDDHAVHEKYHDSNDIFNLTELKALDRKTNTEQKECKEYKECNKEFQRARPFNDHDGYFNTSHKKQSNTEIKINTPVVSMSLLRNSTSTVSLVIPEESELLVHEGHDSLDSLSPSLSAQAECKSTNFEEEGEDMDNSRHSYNLNLVCDLDSFNLNLESTTSTTNNNNFNDESTNEDTTPSSTKEKQNKKGGWLPTAISSESDESKNIDLLQQSQGDDNDSYELNLGLDLDEGDHESYQPEKAIKSATVGILCPIQREEDDDDDHESTNKYRSERNQTSFGGGIGTLLNPIARENYGGATKIEDPRKTKGLVRSIRKSVSMLNLSTLRKNKKQLNADDISFSTPRFTSAAVASSSKPLKSILRNSLTSPNNVVATDSTNDATPSSSDDDDDDNTAIALKTDDTMKRVTSFSNIEIREYDVTLGDNPGGASGPPISLDWNYNDARTQIVDVDLYEEHRPPRRNRIEMHMQSNVRSYRLLKEKGFSLKEIRKAAERTEQIRKQRSKTVRRIQQREIFKQKIAQFLPSSK